MTVRDAYLSASRVLKESGSPTPVLDAAVLLSDALGLSKERLYASFDNLLSEKEERLFGTWLEKRKNGYPVAYLRSKKEFFSLEFYVDERVLIPRPDTELLVEKAIEALQGRAERLDPSGAPIPLRALDLCCGSGCVAIAIAYALEESGPSVEILASDCSAAAGDVFRHNCRQILGRELPFLLGDLFAPVAGVFSVIASNPPYLTDDEYGVMKASGWPEPETALRAGSDGLDFLRRIVEDAWAFLEPGGRLLLETGAAQTEAVAQLLRGRGYDDVGVSTDLAGRPRVVSGARP